ncbi:MAG: protein kinase, partial [Verrucomicrobiota bacterium]
MTAPTEGNYAPPTVEALQAALPQFEIIEMIGVGGMGAVYKAKQPKLDRLVAIKLLQPPASDLVDFESRFQLEAKALAKMKHDRIVMVYDFGETEEGMLYIVMEYVDGEDLTDVIHRGALSPKHMIAVMTQVCDALNYAHGNNVIHRDIKPANIMLNVEGQVKVADFGLARIANPGETNNPEADDGVTLGSPDYIAPEQLEMGVEGDERSDIYSLGIMMYEMLTGKVPRGAALPPSEVNPALDSRLDDVVFKAMQLEPEYRYQAVSELWTELERISTTQPVPAQGQVKLNTGGGAVRKRPTPAPVAAGRSGTPAWVYLSIFIGVVVVAFVGYQFISGDPEDPTDPIAEVENPEPEPQPEPSPPTPEPEPEPGPVAVVPEPPTPTPSPSPAEPVVPTVRETEASIAVAKVFDRFRRSFQRSLAAELNQSYLTALQREGAKFQSGGDPTAAAALAAEATRLQKSSDAPIESQLPGNSPERLVQLRKIYDDAIAKKEKELMAKAVSIVVPKVEAELQELEAQFSVDGKTSLAFEVAAVRKMLGERGLSLVFDSGPKPLKVFILCGQANMLGSAHVSTMNAMRLNPTTKPILDAMRDANGEPVVLDQVWISAINGNQSEKTGQLTAGFGERRGGPRFGPEYTFGIYAQQLLNEPILIIKVTDGGVSLDGGFRPPSAGAPTNNETKPEDVSRHYRLLIDHVRNVLADPKRVYPNYDAAAGYELAGFVWMQGWNDMVNRVIYPQRGRPDGYDSYSDLLAQFIREVRKDLSAPQMPFVIGVMGVGGPTELYEPGSETNRIRPIHNHFRAAMAAPASLPEFEGNVAAVLLEEFWDLERVALQKRAKPIRDEEKRLRDENTLSPDEQKAAIEKLYAETFNAEELEILHDSVSAPDYQYLGSARIYS